MIVLRSKERRAVFHLVLDQVSELHSVMKIVLNMIDVVPIQFVG